MLQAPFPNTKRSSDLPLAEHLTSTFFCLEQVVIKFLPDHGYFKHEMLFYENRQALEGQDAAAFIPQLFDAFSGSMIIHTEDDDAIPPSLVLERGSFTLTVSLLQSLFGTKAQAQNSLDHSSSLSLLITCISKTTHRSSKKK